MAQILHDRYELVQLLGRKAGRRTWLAVDPVTQQQVVIKLLLFSSDFEWDALKLFEREAKTLQDLEHPAIPKYLHWFETDFEGTSGFALVQTYILAQSLEAIVQAGRTFSTADLQNIAEQVLEILDYLHTRNPVVIHRDLKPSNILLGDRTGNSPGRISLVDFGSVQNLAVARGGTITIVGTYGYMPMEQFGDRAVPASDLYSLGATILYLATGKDPADLLFDNLQIQLNDGIPLTSELNAWIQQLMQMNLKDRPTSAKAAIELLHHPITLPQPIVTLADQRIPRPERCQFQVHESTDKTLTFSFPSHKLKVVGISSKYYRSTEILELGLNGLSRISNIVILVVSALIVISIFLALIFNLVQNLLFGVGLLAIILLGYFFYWNYISSCSTIIHIDESNIKLIPRIRNNSNKLAAKYLLNPAPTLVERSPGTTFQKYKVWEIKYIEYPTSTVVEIKIGDRILQISGRKVHLSWLAKELSYYLEVPLQ